MLRRHDEKLRLWIGAALILGGCTPPTEIVLDIDTDLEGSDRLQVEVIEPSGGLLRSDADLTVQPAPRRVVLVQHGEALGPIRTTLTAEADDRSVSIRRELWFQPGERARLSVFIPEDCWAFDCGEPELSCAAGPVCRPLRVRSCEFMGQTCLPHDSPDASPDGN